MVRQDLVCTYCMKVFGYHLGQLPESKSKSEWVCPKCFPDKVRGMVGVTK
jgi:Predicted integral membrane zinc-ribbon metal-binding protein